MKPSFYVLLFFMLLPTSVLADALDDCNEMLAHTGAPRYQGGYEPEHTALCRSGYVLAHNSEYGVPDWVLEDLVPDRLDGSADRDRSRFRPDPDLIEERRAELKDYKRSGFDRGHMAPAADMKWSQDAMDESFYLSNMAPQVGIGFNRHIWAELEGAVRDWTRKRSRTIAITGPIYADPSPEVIGSNRVSVPSDFYKIIFEPNRKRALAFILPNKKISGNDLKPFRVSIDEIEEKTGLDFLTALSKRDQRRIERRVSNLWRR